MSSGRQRVQWNEGKRGREKEKERETWGESIGVSDDDDDDLERDEPNFSSLFSPRAASL